MAINFLMWIRKREIGNEVSLTHILSREIHELEETCYDHVKLHEIRVKLHEKVASSSLLSKLLYLIIAEEKSINSTNTSIMRVAERFCLHKDVRLNECDVILQIIDYIKSNCDYMY